MLNKSFYENYSGISKLPKGRKNIEPYHSYGPSNTNILEFYKSVRDGAYFQARREEKLSSTHYFVRAGNKEFNFSNNPTFFTASTGDFTQPTFFKDPKVYITTVGLFNDSNELLAVAKLSQPVLKSYSREALIKVKLDF